MFFVIDQKKLFYPANFNIIHLDILHFFSFSFKDYYNKMPKSSTVVKYLKYYYFNKAIR